MRPQGERGAGGDREREKDRDRERDAGGKDGEPEGVRPMFCIAYVGMSPNAVGVANRLIGTDAFVSPSSEDEGSLSWGRHGGAGGNNAGIFPSWYGVQQYRSDHRIYFFLPTTRPGDGEGGGESTASGASQQRWWWIHPLLGLFHIAHVIIFIDEGRTFDAFLYLRLFRSLQIGKRRLSQQVEDALINPTQHMAQAPGRVVPSVLFVFAFSPSHALAGSATLRTRWQNVIEAQVKGILENGGTFTWEEARTRLFMFGGGGNNAREAKDSKICFAMVNRARPSTSDLAYCRVVGTMFSGGKASVGSLGGGVLWDEVTDGIEGMRSGLSVVWNARLSSKGSRRAFAGAAQWFEVVGSVVEAICPEGEQKRELVIGLLEKPMGLMDPLPAFLMKMNQKGERGEDDGIDDE